MATVVPISALEHFSYCPRQCALIHVEATYLDNLWTAEGSAAHRRVDAATTWNGGRVMRGLPLFSDRLSLIGRADAVEMEAGGVPYPVEYKNAEVRDWAHETVQVCAQALCLEEMFGVDVPAGAVYYVRSRRRREVIFSETIRDRTSQVIDATRTLLETGTVPVMRPAARCRRCSLRPACLPEVTGRPRAVSVYMAALREPADD